MISWSDVAALDPPLGTIPAATQTSILKFVLAYLNEPVWGQWYDQASLLLAAHMGALTLRGGGGASSGIVTSESAGGVSRSYAPPTMGRTTIGNFGVTIWGQQYQGLTRAVLGGGMVI